jgi:zinc transport system substrate-binding protein
MEKVLENTPKLPVIEASHGVSLLEGVAHNHGEAADHEPEHETGHEEDSHAGHDHAHAENGHVWLDVERYRMQVSAVTKELQVLLPEQAEALTQAASAYDEKLAVLSSGVEDLREHTEGIHVVIFHDAFAYLAESLGMEVLMALSLDEDTLPGAGEIAEVIEEIKYHKTALVFIEELHASYADKILAETNATVVYINPLTTGDGAADSYLSGMWENLSAIRQAVE